MSHCRFFDRYGEITAVSVMCEVVSVFVIHRKEKKKTYFFFFTAELLFFI